MPLFKHGERIQAKLEQALMVMNAQPSVLIAINITDALVSQC